MAHTRHRKKTLRKNTELRLKNRGERSKMRTAVKKAKVAIAAGEGEADALQAAASHVDKAGRKRLIHPNKANRIKSRLAKARNRASAS